MHLAPQPGHGDLVVGVAVLTFEQRSPDLLEHFLRDVLLDPVLAGDVLELGPVFALPEAEAHEAGTDAVKRRQGAEEREIPRRREVVDLAVVEPTDLRLDPVEPVTETEFVNQIDDRRVAGEDVVIVRFEARAADVKRAYEATKLGAGFEELDLVATLHEAVRRGHAGDPATNDDDFH